MYWTEGKKGKGRERGREGIGEGERERGKETRHEGVRLLEEKLKRSQTWKPNSVKVLKDGRKG